jgi:formaldehyde-activating enzyme involved in methanogenesis
LREARTAAVAAVGGVLAGAATVAVARAVAKSAQSGRLLPGRRRQKVVASRSFLVDVHLLGK